MTKALVPRDRRSKGIQRFHLRRYKSGKIARVNPKHVRIPKYSIMDFISKDSGENVHLRLWEEIERTREYKGDDFFHSTFTDRLKGIIKHGLMVVKEKFYDVSGDEIYLCQEPSGAGYWADLQNLMGMGQRKAVPVLLRIRGSWFDKRNVYPDYDEMGSKMSNSTCYKFKGRIHPGSIEIYLDKIKKFVPLRMIMVK